MTIPLVTALHAAETLAAFHRQHAENNLGAAQEYHLDMVRRCAEDAEHIRRAILANSVTVDHQADAVRRRDLEIALRIIERHPIMHGIGMAVDAVAMARVTMARDIADALAAARGGTAS